MTRFQRIVNGAPWMALGLILSGVVICARASVAQEAVTIHVDVADASGNHAKKGAPDWSNVAVWLSPLDATPVAVKQNASAKPAATIVQKDKMFEPHVTVIQVGSKISFPNLDPYFHNVFSLYNGKRFDLGLYEAGTTKSIPFDRPGVSYLFCNIHENMSAVVIAVDTPYFGVSDRAGRIAIASVPDGRYMMHVFYERSTAEELKALDRTVTIGAASHSIESVHLVESPDVTLAHKNKYGEDYVPPPSSAYGP